MEVLTSSLSITLAQEDVFLLLLHYDTHKTLISQDSYISSFVFHGTIAAGHVVWGWRMVYLRGCHVIVSPSLFSILELLFQIPNCFVTVFFSPLRATICTLSAFVAYSPELVSSSLFCSGSFSSTLVVIKVPSSSSNSIFSRNSRTWTFLGSWLS